MNEDLHWAAQLPARGGLTVGLAQSADEVREAQRLRYRVFAEELGASVLCPEPGVEADRFDPFCDHLVVLDGETGVPVAYTRILTDTRAEEAGGFYSESEFDLHRLKAAPGRTLEIGRTCVHPDYRKGVTISVLWTGLARYMDSHKIDRMIGCASISMSDGGGGAMAAYEHLRQRYLAPPELRAVPRRPVAANIKAGSAPLIPPLLKAYIRLGAMICGAPCRDPDFNTADLLVLLQLDRLRDRYARHYKVQR